MRWAGKSTGYSSGFGQFTAVVVLLGNLSFIGILLSLFFGYFEYAPLLLVKFIADYLLAKRAAVFYKTSINAVLRTALVYPFFSSAVAIYSLFGSYQWKGRQFK